MLYICLYEFLIYEITYYPTTLELKFFFKKIEFLIYGITYYPTTLELKFSLIEFLIYGVTYCLTTLELKFFWSRIPYLWNDVLPYYLKTDHEDLSLKTLACNSKNIAELIRGFDPDRPHVTWAWNHGNYQFICVIFFWQFLFLSLL